MSGRSLLNLREHCAKLSRFFGDQEVYANLFQLSGELDDEQGENINWWHVAEWLYIAASIETVDIDTTHFDPSVLYCGEALKYEVDRSELLSKVTTALSVFNFTWGSLESVIKLIEPPKVPKAIKSRTSPIDEAIYYLKTDYEPEKPLTFFDDVMAEMCDVLTKVPYYASLALQCQLKPHMSISGIGLNIVRRLRNKFAHGTLQMPQPEQWSDIRPFDTQLIELSTRTVLMSIQMLTMAYIRAHDFRVELYNDDLEKIEESAYHYLRLLHTSIEHIESVQARLL
jgi:hypothetical protein